MCLLLGVFYEIKKNKGIGGDRVHPSVTLNQLQKAGRRICMNRDKQTINVHTISEFLFCLFAILFFPIVLFETKKVV